MQLVVEIREPELMMLTSDFVFLIQYYQEKCPAVIVRNQTPEQGVRMVPAIARVAASRERTLRELVNIFCHTPSQWLT